MGWMPVCHVTETMQDWKRAHVPDTAHNWPEQYLLSCYIMCVYVRELGTTLIVTFEFHKRRSYCVPERFIASQDRKSLASESDLWS
jgi:hypothetical protein